MWIKISVSCVTTKYKKNMLIQPDYSYCQIEPICTISKTICTTWWHQLRRVTVLFYRYKLVFLHLMDRFVSTSKSTRNQFNQLHKSILTWCTSSLAWSLTCSWLINSCQVWFTDDVSLQIIRTAQTQFRTFI